MEPQPIQLDARGLEPPQPMMKILEAIAALPADATLAAHTDRQPLLLYPMLEQRGFTYETIKQSDGSHLTHIRRR
jgi:TusA-related sulfurtransferase